MRIKISFLFCLFLFGLKLVAQAEGQSIEQLDKQMKTFSGRLRVYSKCLRGKCSLHERNKAAQAIIKDGMILLASLGGILIASTVGFYVLRPTKKISQQVKDIINLVQKIPVGSMQKIDNIGTLGEYANITKISEHEIKFEIPFTYKKGYPIFQKVIRSLLDKEVKNIAIIDVKTGDENNYYLSHYYTTPTGWYVDSKEIENGQIISEGSTSPFAMEVGFD